jgi:hypothetical protein
MSLLCIGVSNRNAFNIRFEVAFSEKSTIFFWVMKRLFACTMGDHGFVLICSGIPGDRDALYFLQERKPIFSFLGNIFWLKCNYTHTKKLCYILNYIFMCFFAKNYKIVSSNLKPRVHLGRQASKNEINKSKPWSPIVRVNRWVCEKIVQNGGQTIFCSN